MFRCAIRTPVWLALALAGMALAQQRPPAEPRPTVVHTELAYPTGERSTSVLLLERFTPSEVRAGTDFEYQIRLTNLTRVELQDVVLTEQFPPNFTPRTLDPSTSLTPERRSGWQWSRLGSGATVVVRVQGTPTESEPLKFCATVSVSTVICARTNVVEPNLVLTQTISPEVDLCEPVVLRLVVGNNGTGVMHGVRISDTLPSGLVTSDNKTGFVINVGELEAGQSREYVVELRATLTGEMTNTAQAEEAGGLQAKASAKTLVRLPILKVTQRGPRFRYAGRPITFEITVQNTGDAPASDTVLVETVPVGSEFISAEGGGQFADGRVMWSLGTLAPSASRTVTVTLRSAGVGMVESAAVARARCAQASASAAAEIRGIPAILLEMVDDPDPIEIDATTTYTIVVTNQGSADDANIAITALIPSEEDFVSCDGATRGALDGKTVTFAALRSLAPKAKATWKVVVKGNHEADVRFKVVLNSDATGKVPVEKTESTHIY